MSYRVDGGARVGGAHRPWGTEPTPDKKHTLAYETEVQKAEREACLSCQLPACIPHSANCPVRHYKKSRPKPKGGRKPMEPPPVFVKHGNSMISNREWAEHFGVSVSMVQRWRKKLGYQRTSIKTKGE